MLLPATTDGAPSERPRGLSRRLPIVALVGLGSLLGVLPHLVARYETGDFASIADGDMLLYLSWSRDLVREGGSRLTDGVHDPSGPVMHPPLLFLPPAYLARMLGLDMPGLIVVWRALAGGGIALGLYVAFRCASVAPPQAIALAAWLLCDPGFLFGQPIVGDLEILATAPRGFAPMLDGVPRLMPHLRVATPALAIPFYLVAMGLITRAGKFGRPRDAAAAAAALGSLFHVFFYFWTTAIAGAALAFLVEPSRRRTLALIVLGGLLIGVPAIIEGARIKATTPGDWLQRTDKFVSIPRLSEWEIPKTVVACWILIGVYVLRVRRDLIYPWCCAGAGLLLRNQQVVSGMSIENFHWTFAYGTALSFLVGACASPWFGANPRRARWGCLIVIAQVALGVGFRMIETRSAESRRIMETYATLRREGLIDRARGIVAGDVDGTFVLAALGSTRPLSTRLVEYSSLATDLELDERLLLNIFLEGKSAEEARSLVRQPPGSLSREAHARRDLAVAEASRTRRLGLIERIWSAPEAYLEKYEVGGVLRRRDRLRDSEDPPGRTKSQAPRWMFQEFENSR